jgi:succinate-acetate transporter protein
MKPVIYAICFLPAALILLTGYLVKYHSTKYPDTSCGFHVGTLYDKSESAWEEANRYSGSLFIKFGCFFLALSVVWLLALNFVYRDAILENPAAAGLLIAYPLLSALISCVAGILKTKHHLQQLFNEFGNKK